MVDVGGESVSCFQRLEDLVVVDESLVAVVDNTFEAEVCLLPYQYVNRGGVGEGSDGVSGLKTA